MPVCTNPWPVFILLYQKLIDSQKYNFISPKIVTQFFLRYIKLASQTKIKGNAIIIITIVNIIFNLIIIGVDPPCDYLPKDSTRYHLRAR